MNTLDTRNSLYRGVELHKAVKLRLDWDKIIPILPLLWHIREVPHLI